MKYLKKILFFTMFCSFSFFNACKTSQFPNVLPTCISEKIEKLKSQTIQNPPSEVWKWENEDNMFYFFNAACCDQYSILYNDNCETICAPDGGFTGRGDGKCPEFSNETVKTLIWKDERKNAK